MTQTDDATAIAAGASRRSVLWALPAATLARALLTSSPASALTGPTYLPLDVLDLTTILPSPPNAETTAQSDDIATVIAIQNASSRERREQAVLDAEISPGRFVGDLLGSSFTPTNGPRTFALLHRITEEGAVFTQKAKEHWARPRPFFVDPRIQVLIKKPTNAAYPSGHTIFAYQMAVILGAMAPETRDALFVRASDYGQSRIIVGVHYLTDINAGRIAGTVIAAMLLGSERFRQDLAAATNELRRARGDGSPPEPTSKKL